MASSDRSRVKSCDEDAITKALCLCVECDDSKVEQTMCEPFFSDLVKKFEVRNAEMLKQLEEMYERIEIMEVTAPALMAFNLFKEINTNPSLDYNEYVESLLQKPSTFCIGDAETKQDENFSESVKGRTPSNETVTLKQLLMLEKLMSEEKMKKIKIERMIEREEQAKEKVAHFDIPPSEMYQKAAKQKVYVPYTKCQPKLVELAGKLASSMSDLQNCDACSNIKFEGLSETVTNMIRTLKYCALAENERDKPDLPVDENIKQSKSTLTATCQTAPVEVCPATETKSSDKSCPCDNTQDSPCPKPSEISLCSMCCSKKLNEISLCDCSLRANENVQQTKHLQQLQQSESILDSNQLKDFYIEMITKVKYH